MGVLIIVLLITVLNFKHLFASKCLSHSPSSDPEWHNEKVTETCEGNYCTFESQSNIVRRGCSSLNMNKDSKECTILDGGRRRCYCTDDMCNKNYGSNRDRGRSSFNIVPKKNITCFVCCPFLGGNCDEIALGTMCSSYKFESRTCLHAHFENRTFASGMPDYLFGKAKMCSNPDFYGTTSCSCNYDNCNLNDELEIDQGTPMKTCCSGGGNLKVDHSRTSFGCTQKCTGHYCGLEYFEDDRKLEFAQFCLNSTESATTPVFDLTVEFGFFHHRASICDTDLCNEQFHNRSTSTICDTNRFILIIFLLFFVIFVHLKHE